MFTRQFDGDWNRIVLTDFLVRQEPLTWDEIAAWFAIWWVLGTMMCAVLATLDYIDEWQPRVKARRRRMAESNKDDTTINQ